ncbi:hypothetical protein ACOMHN_041261 [Nucella lapillus]
MEVVSSNKGGQKVILDGFIYTKQVTKPNNIRWRCVQRGMDCKGTLVTTLDLRNPQIGNRHNHDASEAKVSVAKSRLSMKEQAKNTFDKPCQIFSQAAAEIDVEARTELGREDSVKRSLRNQRLGHFPAVPDSLQNLIIDGEWAQTSGPDPQQFLINDNGPDTDTRVIVFGTSEALQQLCTADTWYMDGNHAVAPEHFCQLYVIRCLLGDTAVSTVYALLQRKLQATYELLLQAIVDKCRLLHMEPDPSTIVIDFEQAMMRAILAVLGDHITVQGCFYHLTQSTWRKIQELGMTNRYRDAEEVKLFCGMVDALALLPIGDLTEALDFLEDSTPEGLEPLLDYFKRTYCTGTFRRVQRQAQNGENVIIRHTPPLFSPAMWNVHQVTLQGEQFIRHTPPLFPLPCGMSTSHTTG